jgi:hypothetical protein
VADEPRHSVSPHPKKLKKKKNYLRLIQCQVTNMYEGIEVHLHVFLTPELNGGEWRHSAAGLPQRMRPQEPSDMRLGEPQSRSGHSGQQEVPSPAGNQTSVLNL